MPSETIADIVAEMRYGAIPKHQTDHELLAIYADRIDAAAYAYDPTKTGKSELPDGSAYALEAFKANKAKGPTTVGNDAAMREALELCYRVIHCAMVTGVINRDDANKAMDAYHAALAAPPRNCDVGNEKEQAQRIDAFCKSHGTDRNGYYRCEECPLLKIDRCELKWAQMPYEAEEGGAK